MVTSESDSRNYVSQGWFTPWTMKSPPSPVKSMIGCWTRPGIHFGSFAWTLNCHHMYSCNRVLNNAGLWNSIWESKFREFEAQFRCWDYDVLISAKPRVNLPKILVVAMCSREISLDDHPINLKRHLLDNDLSYSSKIRWKYIIYYNVLCVYIYIYIIPCTNTVESNSAFWL